MDHYKKYRDYSGSSGSSRSSTVSQFPKRNRKKVGRPSRNSGRFKPKKCVPKEPKEKKRRGRPARTSDRFKPKRNPVENVEIIPESNEELSQENIVRPSTSIGIGEREPTFDITVKPSYPIESNIQIPAKRPRGRPRIRPIGEKSYKPHKQKCSSEIQYPKKPIVQNPFTGEYLDLENIPVYSACRLVALTPEKADQAYFNVQFLSDVFIENYLLNHMMQQNWVTVKPNQLFYSYEHGLIPNDHTNYLLLFHKILNQQDIQELYDMQLPSQPSYVPFVVQNEDEEPPSNTPAAEGGMVHQLLTGNLSCV